MRIGIVGSRRRNTLADRLIVQDIIVTAAMRFGSDTVIVSGGCGQGADRFAKEYTECWGIRYVEYPIPTDPPAKNKWEFTRRAYARNRQIVENSDVIFALVHPDRTGGTENTVLHAKDLGRRCFLVDGFGRAYLSKDVEKDADTA